MGKRHSAIKGRTKNQPVTGNSSNLVDVLLLSLAILFTIVAYARSVHGPLVFDDTYVIDVGRFNKVLHSFHLGSRSLSELSFALNSMISGMSPAGFRVINIAIHILTALSAFGLTHFTLNTPYMKERFGGYSGTVSAAVAVLFLLHPLQTGAVNYITQRMVIMASMFSFLGLLMYAKAALKTGGKSFPYYFLSACFFFFAIFSKENAVMVLFMVPLYDLVFLSSFRWKEFRKRFIPFAVLATALVIATARALSVQAFVQNIMTLVSNPHRPMGSYGWSGVDLQWTPSEYILTELRVVSRYIVLMFFPAPSMMAFDYSNAYPVSKGLFHPLSTFLSLLFLVSLLSLALRYIKKFPLAAFGILWYLVTISLESFIALGLDPYFEHRNYLPGFGLFLAVASLIVYVGPSRTGEPLSVAGRRRSFGRSEAIIAGILVVLSIATYVRNGVWTSEELLWKDALKKSPHNPRAFISLGTLSMNEKRFQEAEDYLRRAGQVPSLTPTFKTTILFKRAMLYRETGRKEDAMATLKTIVGEGSSSDSNRSDAYFIMGEIQRGEGRLHEAKQYFEKAYEIRRDNPVLLTSLGFVSQSLGQTEKAEAYFRKSLEIAPDQFPPNVELGVIYFAKGEIDTAERYFERVIAMEERIPPQIAKKVFLSLAQIKLAKNDLDDSARLFRKVMEIDPAFYPPYIFLGDISLKKGDYDAALSYLARALSMKGTFEMKDPNTKLIYFKLGLVHNAKGNTKLARENFSRFIVLAGHDKGFEASVRSARENLAHMKE
jgi:tetratricopeptide (TPR) repeat protein